jgi:hypothetical protein
MVHLFVRTAVEAFFFQDLVTAAKQLLAGATGTFGLVLTSSLDVQREVVIAARGQSMSIAFYPLLGVVAWGSEAAATKAAIGLAQRPAGVPDHNGTMEGFRYDLDDVNGELVRIAWDSHARPQLHCVGRTRSAAVRTMSVGSVKSVQGNAETERYPLLIGAEGDGGVEMFRYGKHGAVRAAHYIQCWNSASPSRPQPIPCAVRAPVGAADLVDLKRDRRREREGRPQAGCRQRHGPAYQLLPHSLNPPPLIA